jgi:hypothetical protein
VNKDLLLLTRDNLMAWVGRCQEETVSVDKKLELIMFSLADMCAALSRDTEETAPSDDES